MLSLTVTLNAPSGKTVAVLYNTSDGTAVAPGDYAALTNRVLEFPPGVTSQTVQVSVTGDVVREPSEFFSVTLSAPSHASILRATATATIRDNDDPSDLNGDGHADLLWRNQETGGLVVWLMNGVNRMVEEGLTPFVAPLTLRFGGVADFYQDGTSDLVWQDTITGEVSVWRMSGLTRVGVDTLAAGITDLAWRLRAVADINGDRHPDLVWQHTDGWTAVSMLVGSTAVAVHLLSPAPVGAGWQLVATADLDRDGHTDVVWHNDQTGDLSWWKLDGHSQVAAGVLSPANVAQLPWKVRGAADFDNDGMADLIWQHAEQVSVWLMNGTTARTWISFTPDFFGDPAWRLVGPR